MRTGGLLFSGSLRRLLKVAMVGILFEIVSMDDINDASDTLLRMVAAMWVAESDFAAVTG